MADSEVKREYPRIDPDGLPQSHQESLATAICLIDDENTRQLADRVDPSLFDPPFDDIVERCLKYRHKYQRPPGKEHLDDLFSEELNDKQHKRHKSYYRLLHGLVAQSNRFNSDYVLDLYMDFAHARTIRQGIAAAAETYQTTKRADEARRAAEKYFDRAENAGRPKFDVQPMSEVKVQPFIWHWDYYIPMGKCFGILGVPDVGKSLVLVDFAVTFAGGFTWPNGKPADRGKVLMMSTEDTVRDVLAPRLIAAGAGSDEVMHRIHRPIMRDKLFSLKHDLHDLEMQLKEHRYKAVFIEPFYAFVGDKVDTYRDSEMQRLLAPVTELADRYGTTLFCNVHFNKNNDAAAIDRVSGARGTAGTFRAAYAVVPDPDDDRCSLFLKVKNNHVRRGQPGWKFEIKSQFVQTAVEAPFIEWVGEDDRKLDDLLSGRKTRKSKKGDAASAFLLDQFSAGPRYASEIESDATEAGLKWRTVQKTAEDMGILRKRKGFSGPWMWQLPE